MIDTQMKLNIYFISRFKLENLPEPTVSPGSNSSSEQNDAQSSIISVAPTIPSPVIPSSPVIPPSPIIAPASVIPSSPITLAPITHTVNTLSPLVSRPPLPPRIESPREVKSVSNSERESLGKKFIKLIKNKLFIQHII